MHASNSLLHAPAIAQLTQPTLKLPQSPESQALGDVVPEDVDDAVVVALAVEDALELAIADDAVALLVEEDALL